MKVKEESEKAGLELSIQKMKIMASSPITSWQIVGETMETGDRFYFIALQNPKKSWLAMKPAWSLVDDASLGPQFPPSGSGCPHLPVSGGGWAGPQPASSSQSFVQ